MRNKSPASALNRNSPRVDKRNESERYRCICNAMTSKSLFQRKAKKDERVEEYSTKDLDQSSGPDVDPFCYIGIRFLLLSVSAITFWSTVIVSLPSVQNALYPDWPNLSFSVTASYATSTMITVLIVWYFDLFYHNFLLAGCGGFVLAAFVLSLTFQLAEGFIGVLLIHVCCTIGGATFGLFEIVMRRHENKICAEDLGVLIPLGYSVGSLFCCGACVIFDSVFTLISWGTLEQRTKVSTGLLLTAGAILNFMVRDFFAMLNRQPRADKCLAIAEAATTAKKKRKPSKRWNNDKNLSKKKGKKMWKIDGNELKSQPYKKKRSSQDVFTDAAEQILNGFVSHWIFLTLFPNIAPLDWNQHVFMKGFLMFLMFTGNFGGVASTLFQPLSPKNIKYLCLSCILFFPLFVMCHVPDRVEILSTVWFQGVVIFIFGFSITTVTTLSRAYCIECVEDPDEKEKVAQWYHASVVLGQTIGVGMSKIWHIAAY